MADSRWRSVRVAGRRGRCLSLGRGTEIVLLASPLASGDVYLPTALRLAARGRTHLVEMPGCGRSERLAAAWSLGDYSSWAAGAVAELGLERPALIGHSYAGAVAVVLAARHPQQCGALVVVDAPGSGVPASLGQAAKGAAIDIALDLGLVLTRWHHVAWNAVAHRRNFFGLVREALSMDVTDDARRASVPALVAWGARDHTLPPRGAEAYSACLRDARVYVSPRGTHTWPVSQPEEFADAVGRFLASLGSLSPRSP